MIQVLTPCCQMREVSLVKATKTTGRESIPNYSGANSFEANHLMKHLWSKSPHFQEVHLQIRAMLVSLS